MLVLGIETSTKVSSVALWRDGVALDEVVRDDARAHLEFLAPAIEAILERAGERPASLGAIAVGTGPGLFTGMRIGVATAKAMAQALGVPLAGIPSLDAMACAWEAARVCACIDARRGEVFAAVYEAGVRTGEIEAWDPAALAATLEGPVLVAGDGAASYREVFAAVPEATLDPDASPRASQVVALALPMLERGDVPPVEQVEPLYLRKSEAEIRWEERGVTIERPSRVKVPKRAKT